MFQTNLDIMQDPKPSLSPRAWTRPKQSAQRWTVDRTEAATEAASALGDQDAPKRRLTPCQHTPRTDRSSLACRRGFSLVEILVVIAIIAVLAGLLIAAFMQVQAPVSKTRIALSVLKTCATEYQMQTESIVNHSNAEFPKTNTSNIDWTRNRAFNVPGYNGSSNVESTIERFVWAAWRLPDTQKILTSLKDDGFLVDDSAAALSDEVTKIGFYEIRDPWGHALQYAAFVDHDDSEPRDDFLPEHNTPFFASAGPDGKFGSVNPSASTDEREDAEDNIYSFDVD